MNRAILILSILIVLAIAIVGWMFVYLSTPSGPAPTQQQQPTQQNPVSSTVTVPTGGGYTQQPTGQTRVPRVGDLEAVQAAFRQGLPPGDKTEIKDVAIAGDYALVVWTDDPMGGQTLLKYEESGGGWVVVAVTGGAFSVAGLGQEGVPQRTILTLFNSLR